MSSCDKKGKDKKGAKEFENELDFDVEAGDEKRPNSGGSEKTEKGEKGEENKDERAKGQQAKPKKKDADSLSTWSGVKLDAPPEFKQKVKEDFFF